MHLYRSIRRLAIDFIGRLISWVDFDWIHPRKGGIGVSLWKCLYYKIRGIFTDIGHPLASLSTGQVPRWPLTCVGEALASIPR